MGLDAVELVVRFEDSFGIAISDEAASKLTTPREVTDYIMSQVPTDGQPACLSQQAFYFLRQGFLKCLQIQRADFRLDVPVAKIVPKRHRKIAWAELKAELGNEALPELARSSWLFALLTIVTILVGFYAVYETHTLRIDLRLVIGIASATLAGFTLSLVSRPFRINFRRRFRTVAGLVEYLAVNSPHTFKKETRAWTRKQVEEVVRAIIVEEIGITNFTEDSHFIKDMHID